MMRNKIKKQKNKEPRTITSWTIKVCWSDGKTEFIDTTNMGDDVAQGVDNFLTEKEKIR